MVVRVGKDKVFLSFYLNFILAYYLFKRYKTKLNDTYEWLKLVSGWGHSVLSGCGNSLRIIEFVLNIHFTDRQTYLLGWGFRYLPTNLPPPSKIVLPFSFSF